MLHNLLAELFLGLFRTGTCLSLVATLDLSGLVLVLTQSLGEAFLVLRDKLFEEIIVAHLVDQLLHQLSVLCPIDVLLNH